MNDSSSRSSTSNGRLCCSYVSAVRSTSRTRPGAAELERAVARRPRVAIDLAEVEYLDSQGLRLIKKLNDSVKSNGGELQLVAPPDTFARQAFEMARMSDFIQIRDTLEG